MAVVAPSVMRLYRGKAERPGPRTSPEPAKPTYAHRRAQSFSGGDEKTSGALTGSARPSPSARMRRWMREDPCKTPIAMLGIHLGKNN